MKIALIGYGKMGKELEHLALKNGDEIVMRIDSKNTAYLTENNLKKADVAIEFSKPILAVQHIEMCLEAGVPVVVGTTGWYEKLDYIASQCKQKEGSIVYGSNFSVGVNMFFKLNESLAEMMSSRTDYAAWIEETHHKNKLDKPSGTAITLANAILKNNQSYSGWSLEEKQDKLPIFSLRIDEVTGLHTVCYRSGEDTIEITHQAFNRLGFAKGTLQAAAWIVNHKGLYDFKSIFAAVL
jgi:4-hydroxy-tetrahydrodipicolinate reductase